MPVELDENKLKVLNEFRLFGQASKADVARRVNLTHPAVSQIVMNLCEAGYLEEEMQKRKGQRGQPATIYSLSDHNVFLGIHVGRRRLEIVGFGLNGTTLASAKLDVGFLQKNELIEQSRPELARFLSLPAITQRNIVGIGISTPHFWEGWQEMLHLDESTDHSWNFDRVTDLFDFPEDVTLLVENDGSAAALGELTFGSGANHRDFLYVHIGTFIGGGLVIDGTLRTGTHGNTGVLGPFPVNRSTLNGARVSSRPFEPLLGRASIQALREHAERNGAEVDFVHGEARVASKSSSFVDEWIEDCSAALAQCFIGVWSLIDVEAIILDGALPRDLLQRIVDSTELKIRDLRVEGIIPSSIKLGELGTMAQSVGAACLPVLRVLGPPPMARER